jgi:hypothetical protein
MWATAAGCGLRAAHAPVIEYPAPSRRPIVVHVSQWRCRQIAIAAKKT